MKIGQKPELPGAMASSAPAKQARSAPSSAEGAAAAVAPASVAAAGVPVTFSTAARALDPSGRLAGDFDVGKVKAVRAAIDSGSFKVDAQAVADKMLSNSQEFLSRTRV